MALTFNASGRYVNHRTGDPLRNIVATYGAITVWAWVYRTGTGGNQSILDKYLVYPQGWQFLYDGGLRFIQLRGGTYGNRSDAAATADSVPLNQWAFVAATLNESDAGISRICLYTGSLLSPVHEVESYSLRQAGTGTASDDFASSLYAGNSSSDTSFYFQGAIARVGVHGSVTTINQLQRIQRTAWIERIPDVAQNCLLATDYLIGESIQHDYSSKGNDGTVTSAIVAPHLPLSLLSVPLPPWQHHQALTRVISSGNRRRRLLLCGSR